MDFNSFKNNDSSGNRGGRGRGWRGGNGRGRGGYNNWNNNGNKPWFNKRNWNKNNNNNQSATTSERNSNQNDNFNDDSDFLSLPNNKSIHCSSFFSCNCIFIVVYQFIDNDDNCFVDMSINPNCPYNNWNLYFPQERYKEDSFADKNIKIFTKYIKENQFIFDLVKK
jgi:hypothetical protein